MKALYDVSEVTSGVFAPSARLVTKALDYGIITSFTQR